LFVLYEGEAFDMTNNLKIEQKSVIGGRLGL